MSTKIVLIQENNMRRVAGLSYASVVRREVPIIPKPIVITDWEFDRMYYADMRRKRKEKQSQRGHSDDITRHTIKILSAYINSDTRYDGGSTDLL